jgi:hypothetical protein
MQKLVFSVQSSSMRVLTTNFLRLALTSLIDHQFAHVRFENKHKYFAILENLLVAFATGKLFLKDIIIHKKSLYKSNFLGAVIFHAFNI